MDVGRIVQHLGVAFRPQVVFRTTEVTRPEGWLLSPLDDSTENPQERLSPLPSPTPQLREAPIL